MIWYDYMKIRKGKYEIPDELYQELIELFGYEKTDEILAQNGPEYYWLSYLIIRERIKRKYGLNIRLTFILIFVLLLFCLIYLK